MCSEVQSRFYALVLVGIILALLPYLLLVEGFLGGPVSGNLINSNGGSSRIAYDYPSNVSGVYAQLGYPKLAYFGTPVMNLTRAVALAMSTAHIGPSNFTLAAAEYDPAGGQLPATWSLWFAQVYDGFWLYGTGTVEATSHYVTVDADSSSVSRSLGFPTYQPLPGNYNLGLTAAQALQVVRGLGPFQKFSTVLTQNGNLAGISPRIIKFDTQATSDLQRPMDSGLDGESRLCWVILLEFRAPGNGGGEQGRFAVDAQTGRLVSGWEQKLVPYSIPPPVPGVFVRSPGTTASVHFDYSHSVPN